MSETRSGGMTPHRRRDDLMDSEAMLGMVRFLMTRPTCEQICQQLVLSLLTRHEPRQCVIALFGADGSLHAVGEFGLAKQQIGSVARVSLWDAVPLADAVRTGEPIVVDGPDPLVAWPLSLPSQRVGALQVTFARQPSEEELRADVTGIAAVLALYLSLLTSIAATPDRAIEILGAADGSGGFPVGELAVLQRPPSSKQAPASLSPRQMQILELMASGMTNSQIAKRIGYSESTVRQETMVIYRYFGVGGRQEAVHQAQVRGVLAED